MGADMVISKICVRDASRQRDFALDTGKTQVEPMLLLMLHPPPLSPSPRLILSLAHIFGHIWRRWSRT